MSAKMFPENASDAKKIVNFKQVVYNYRRDSIQAFKMWQEKRRTMRSVIQSGDYSVESQGAFSPINVQNKLFFKIIPSVWMWHHVVW